MCACKFLSLASALAFGAHAGLPNETLKQVASPQLRLYGVGNCKPNRPQWELCNGVNFHICQHACLSSDKCLGFDYDPAFDGCCRVRFGSNIDLKNGMPQGFAAIEGEDGDGFNGTTGSETATCYEKANHRYNMLKYGNGNCAPNRPQQHGYLTFAACQQSCIENALCIGFDYDPKWLYCRIRFQTVEDAMQEATSGLGYAAGLTADAGVEGPGFTGTDASHATCYVKPDRPFSGKYDLLVYGSGNCKPERPQWEYCNGADFHFCQQTCVSIGQCIGFDYDAANGGCCRIRFSSNADVMSASKPPEFKSFTGEEGPGFVGSSGPASATCYVKPSHPSSTKYDLFIYGPGNCQPDRPQWKVGNPATFGVCQQTCLETKECMGFDYDPAFGGYCRVRFATNNEANSLLSASATSVGFSSKPGEEGYGFTSSSGQRSSEAAICYVKPIFPGAAAEKLGSGSVMSLPKLSAAFIGIAIFMAIMLRISKARHNKSIIAPLLDADSQEGTNAQSVTA